MRALSLLSAFVLLATSCQEILPHPSDGVFSCGGSSITLQGGACVRATISTGASPSYGTPPASWETSSGIQTRGSFPDYQYSCTDPDLSWTISATFVSRTSFTASLYIETGDSKFVSNNLAFELQTP